MEEHGAAATCHPGTHVVIDLDDEVVEAIIAPEAIAWFIGRPPERPVVAAVGGIFAPGDVRVDPPRGQEGAGPRVAIRPPPQLPQTEPPSRGRAVSLPFVGADAGAAKHDRYGDTPREEDAARPAARPRAHTKQQ